MASAFPVELSAHRATCLLRYGLAQRVKATRECAYVQPSTSSMLQGLKRGFATCLRPARLLFKDLGKLAGCRLFSQFSDCVDAQTYAHDTKKDVHRLREHQRLATCSWNCHFAPLQGAHAQGEHLIDENPDGCRARPRP